MNKQIYTYVAIAAVAAFIIGFLIAGTVITGQATKGDEDHSWGCDGFFECLFTKKVVEDPAEEQVQEEVEVEPDLSEEKVEEKTLCESTCEVSYSVCIEEFEMIELEIEAEEYVPACTSIHESCMSECTGEEREEETPNIYERYAVEDIENFVEKEGLNVEEIVSDGKAILRHSTLGKLVPGEIEILDADDPKLQDWNFCDIRIFVASGPHGWISVYHTIQSGHAPEIRREDVWAY